MAIDLHQDWIFDIRQPILGDSFGWAGVEPAAAKKSIVIHGTGSEAPLEDGFTMADYHVNHNDWGGIGVHFVVTEDGYPGKPAFGLPAGVQVQYVGDLLTWRAGCFDQNPGRVHIEISGALEGHPPSEAQLRNTRRLIDFLLAPNNILPSINFYTQVTYHNAVPEQNTACPGWQHPSFGEWFKYLQGGPEPSWWHPVVLPEAPPIAPPPAVPEEAKGGPVAIPVTVIPEQEASYVADREDRTVLRTGAFAINVLTGAVIENSRPNLAPGKVVNAAGYFTFAGRKYARTVYSADHNLWNGVDVTFFDEPTPIPTTTTTNDDQTVPQGYQLVPELTDTEKRDAFLGLSPETKVSLFNRLIEALFSFIARLPIFNKDTK